jgi:Zn-dependent peptidase ImmA (M78 family)
MATRSEKNGRPRNPRVLAFVQMYGGGWSDPRKIMRRVVRRILTQSRYSTPPVSVKNIARVLDVNDIAADPGLMADAVLQETEGQYRIRYRYRLASPRWNFAVLHELSHILFERAVRQHKPYLLASEIELLNKTYHEEERLCEFGASEFLMPYPDFDIAVGEGEPMSWARMERIAKLFDASLEATIFRCCELPFPTFYVERWYRQDGQLVAKSMMLPGKLREVARLAKREYAETVAAAVDGDPPGPSTFTFWLGGARHIFSVSCIPKRAADGSRQAIALVSDLGVAPGPFT